MNDRRQRFVVLAVLITVVFTLATLIGLWVLNQAPSRPGVIFDDRGTTSESLPAGRAGPCPLPENCPKSPVNQMSPLGNS
jgi:hypothetical protein